MYYSVDTIYICRDFRDNKQIKIISDNGVIVYKNTS